MRVLDLKINYKLNHSHKNKVEKTKRKGCILRVTFKIDKTQSKKRCHFSEYG